MQLPYLVHYFLACSNWKTLWVLSWLFGNCESAAKWSVELECLAWLGLTCGLWSNMKCMYQSHLQNQANKKICLISHQKNLFLHLYSEIFSTEDISQILKFWRLSKRGYKSRLCQYSSKVQIRVLSNIQKVMKLGKHTHGNTFILSYPWEI